MAIKQRRNEDTLKCFGETDPTFSNGFVTKNIKGIEMDIVLAEDFQHSSAESTTRLFWSPLHKEHDRGPVN